MNKTQVKIILSGLIGNLVEAYDIAVCGLLSFYIAKYLAPESKYGITFIFIIFFIGYLSRPIGAVALGVLSDRYGRKITLAFSICIMGIATSLIGFIPDHSSMGTYSLLILCFLRIIQSMACGAEYLNSSTYLIESADDGKHLSFWGSWASFGAMSGFLLASITSFATFYFCRTYPDSEWIIWRIPFFLAMFGTSIGIIIRYNTPESLNYVLYYADHKKPSTKNILINAIMGLKYNVRTTFKAFAISFFGVSSTFIIYLYAPSHIHITNNITPNLLAASSILSLCIMLCCFPIFSSIADKNSKHLVLLCSLVAFSLLIYPYFYALSYGNPSAVVLTQSLLALPSSAYYGTAPAILTEMYPLKFRCTSLSFVYSIAASLAAGLIPLASLALTQATQNYTAPAWLIISLSIFTFFVVLLVSKKSLMDTNY